MKTLIISLVQRIQETFLVHILEYFLGVWYALVGEDQTLTPTEQAVLAELKPLVVKSLGEQKVYALIGLTGEGKSYVATRIAHENSATLISSDAIRVALRKARCSYASTNTIARELLSNVLHRGGSAVLDSDHIDPRKRALLARFLSKSRIPLEYVRVIASEAQVEVWVQTGEYGGTIYDPSVANLDNTPGKKVGAALKLEERARHFLWHRRSDGTTRKLRFLHTEVWNGPK